ncbi:Cullin-domain-containing protein [Hortaea werneckii]|nr:Cullin-domain-containing protein [Hortaea werneckii]KAI6907096.1 Cullin-domain-containing protein [Hortaea werneckii]KAI6924341.1 Cullin-domain-containing protein [Hortaea werneckii]KAI6957933.1 Cullin-domain-containing protein [Hortaea werneckii]KAI7017590.1 Cullin-domain-containing protein [Hortaea werneckii]
MHFSILCLALGATAQALPQILPSSTTSALSSSSPSSGLTGGLGLNSPISSLLSKVGLGGDDSIDSFLSALDLSEVSSLLDLTTVLQSLDLNGLLKRDGALGLGLTQTVDELSVQNLLALLNTETGNATQFLSGLGVNDNTVNGILRKLDLGQNATVGNLLRALNLNGTSTVTDLTNSLGGLSKRSALLGLTGGSNSGLLGLDALDLGTLNSLLAGLGLSQGSQLTSVLDTLNLSQTSSLTSLFSGLGLDTSSFDGLLASNGLSGSDSISSVLTSLEVPLDATLGQLFSGLGLTNALFHMQSPSRFPSAQPDIQSSPPTERKRKRQAQEEATNKQRTLQGLLSGQQEPSRVPASTSPRSKRIKQGSANPSTPPKKLARTDMYSFSSRSQATNGNGVVDLTHSSPTSSPQTRRVNGAMKGRGGLNPHTGAKKLVVKNLKQNTGWDSKAYLERIWSRLDAALAIIFTGGQGGFSKEDLYRGVENVCRQGGASTLFSRLESRCRQHVEHDLRDSLVGKAGLDNITVLEAVIAEWARWKQEMVVIRAIFFFLDRSYLLSSSKPTLSDLTPQLFRDVVFTAESLKPKTVDGACDLVARDRTQQQALDKTLFRQAVDMFHELQVYSASFEPRFLGTTQNYVAEWSDNLIVEKSLPQYVALAEAFMASEMARCDEFALDASTKRDLLAVLEDHFVVRKETDLTEYEPLASLLDRNAVADLTALYALLNRRRLGDKLRPAFEKWVDETGTSVVFSKNEDDMIVQLLSLKRRLDATWKTAFQRDAALGHGLRESFETFVNKTKKGEATWGTDNTKVGEMIAKYVDQLLRGGAKAIPEVLTARRASSITAPNQPALEKAVERAEENNEDEEVDEDTEINIQLDQVLDLFRFLQGKAVFEAFYKKDLARRLLMARSASSHAERSMLTRLKTECGAGFTQNLEQMFKDVELAREEMQSYKSRLEERVGYEKGKNVDLTVNILSAAAWPTYPDIPVVIPSNVKKSIDDFELHYKSKHTGRKLDWKHALAHCQMRAKFDKGYKELVVSSFQAVVLLLFNGIKPDEHLPYSHIQTETGLPEQEVKRTLQSLACAKLRPLTKHPKGKEINDTDTFTVNTSFDHPKFRVKINQVQLKETKEENKETHIRVAEDRNFECQAAIVRILKSKKTISHQQLVSETISATMSRGVLAVADIKKNIDRLIEKDYMEREEGNMYSYIA